MALKALSNYAEKKLLDHLLGVSALTMPATVYLAAFKNNPGPDASGDEVKANGTPGDGYSRKAITFNAAIATDSTPPHAPGGDGNGPGLATNDGDVEFDECTGNNWGEITHIALFDAATSGNMLVYGAVATPQTINVGGTLRLKDGDLKITLD
jgi:hypothetical protein